MRIIRILIDAQPAYGLVEGETVYRLEEIGRAHV